MSTKAERVVNAFIKAADAQNLDAMIALCHEDVIYENDPVGGGKGHDFVRKFLGSLMSADRVEWEVLRQTASETCIMNERVDRFWNNGDPTPSEIPLMGVFDVDKNGLITRWVDYWDANKYAAQKKAANEHASKL